MNALRMFRISFRFALACLAIGVAVTGCSPPPKSAVGFRLPDGNADRGKQAFIDLKCFSCHTVDGVNLSPHEVTGQLNVVLGGETPLLRSYGQLVTAIINPSHVISAQYKKQLEGKLSAMPEFNNVMTVQQMIDLVAFLQPRYRLPAPDVVAMAN